MRGKQYFEKGKQNKTLSLRSLSSPGFPPVPREPPAPHRQDTAWLTCTLVPRCNSTYSRPGNCLGWQSPGPKPRPGPKRADSGQACPLGLTLWVLASASSSVLSRKLCAPSQEQGAPLDLDPHDPTLWSICHDLRGCSVQSVILLL